MQSASKPGPDPLPWSPHLSEIPNGALDTAWKLLPDSQVPNSGLENCPQLLCAKAKLGPQREPKTRAQRLPSSRPKTLSVAQTEHCSRTQGPRGVSIRHFYGWIIFRDTYTHFGYPFLYQWTFSREHSCTSLHVATFSVLLGRHRWLELPGHTATLYFTFWRTNRCLQPVSQAHQQRIRGHVSACPCQPL